MIIQELKENGELTNQLTHKFGKPYSLNQKLKTKKYGLGGLIYRLSNAEISDFHDQYAGKVKTHVEPTSEGLIFRLWTSKAIRAFGIRYDQIQFIELIKLEDTINPEIGSPMWILLKMKVPLKYARRFARFGEYECGPIDLKIQCHDCSFVQYEINGFSWDQATSFFNQDPLKNKARIEDENTAGNKMQRSALSKSK